MTGNNAYESRPLSGQRLNIECTVREHSTATIKGFVFCSVRVHMHYDTRIVVSQVGIFPTSVHYTSVVHYNRVPVGILVECQTAQIFILGSIKNHVSYRVITTNARYTLVTDVRVGNNASVRKVSTIIEFQIRLFVLNERFVTCSIQFHFVYIPTSVFLSHQGSKHHAVCIPVHSQVGDRSILYLRTEDTLHLHVTTQVAQFDDLSIKSATTSRFLVTPVISLRTQIRSHSLTSS